MLSNKTIQMQILDHSITFYNQNSLHWSHLYGATDDLKPMHVNACGIFSLCHCSQWLGGQTPTPESLADTAMQLGAVNELGTVRPILLQKLTEIGMAASMGFHYKDNGFLEDTDMLFSFLMDERGVAIGNLRAGHIVSAVAARQVGESKQILILDSMGETYETRVRQKICEVLPETQICTSLRNQHGVTVADITSYGAFWVEADSIHTFNLLHRIL